jgi:hypothetical protein
MASVLLLVGVPALLVAGVTRRGEPDEAEWADDAVVDGEDPVVDVPRPRTVAELVAERERQAAEAAEAEAAEAEAAEAGPAEAEVAEVEAAEPEEEPEEPVEPVDVEEQPDDEDAGNVVQFDRRRRRT